MPGVKIFYEGDRVKSQAISSNCDVFAALDFPTESIFLDLEGSGVMDFPMARINHDGTFNQKKRYPNGLKIWRAITITKEYTLAAKIVDGSIEIPNAHVKLYDVYGTKKLELPNLSEPFFGMHLEHELITTIKKLMKKNTGIAFDMKNGEVNLVIYRGENENQFKLGKVELRDHFTLSVDKMNFKHLLTVMDKNKTYNLQLFENSVFVSSEDNSEQYYIHPEVDYHFVTVENDEGEVIEIDDSEIEAVYGVEVEAPKEWNYNESVQKVRNLKYKWKNLNDEIVAELLRAREVLSKCPSEAAKIMHGTIDPGRTWTQYCGDIGSSRQVVNRWLKLYEKKKQIETDGGKTKPDSETDEYYELAVAVMGMVVPKENLNQEWAGKGWIDLTKLKKKDEFVDKMLSSKKLTEAILKSDPKYSDKQWFQKLINSGGLHCFTNGGGKGYCLSYFGDNLTAFYRKFKEHGVVMWKV
jgi:hypothetical protein